MKLKPASICIQGVDLFRIALGLIAIFLSPGLAGQAQEVGPPARQIYLKATIRRFHGVLIAPDSSTMYFQGGPDNISLNLGSILVCVRRPAPSELISTPLGNVNVLAGSDAIVTVKDRVLSVQNLHGTANSVVLALNHGHFFQPMPSPITIPEGKILTAQSQIYHAGALHGPGSARFAIRSLMPAEANYDLALIEQTWRSSLSSSRRNLLERVSNRPALLMSAHREPGWLTAGNPDSGQGLSISGRPLVEETIIEPARPIPDNNDQDQSADVNSGRGCRTGSAHRSCLCNPYTPESWESGYTIGPGGFPMRYDPFGLTFIP